KKEKKKKDKKGFKKLKKRREIEKKKWDIIPKIMEEMRISAWFKGEDEQKKCEWQVVADGQDIGLTQKKNQSYDCVELTRDRKCVMK
ncbi:hypothetical protein RFI_02666, partial [Reticulomyxa filosa]